MTTPAATHPLRHWQKIIAALFWLLLVGGYGWYAWRNDLGPREAATRLIAALRSESGLALYLAAHLLRPLILFPTTLLALVGGVVFGPVRGIIYAVLGSNASALLAYSIGRFFGGDALALDPQGLLGRYVGRLRANSFATIMTLRIVFVPFDLVNYLAGILKIDWRSFSLATALGALPGTVTFALFGSSLRGSIETAQFQFEPATFLASALIFALSLVMARYFKRREVRRDP